MNLNAQNNDKDPKFSLSDHVRISKYNTFYAKGYIPNWSEEVVVIKMVKSTVPWTNAIEDLNGEENVVTYYEKDLQKTNKTKFRIEKVIKKKADMILLWTVIIFRLIAGYIKKILIYKMSYFPEP